MIKEERILCITADLFDAPALMNKLSQITSIGSVSLIVDDGPHWVDQQIKCMDSLWPLLCSGGLYVIEDASELIHGQTWDGSSSIDGGEYFRLLANRQLPKLLRLYDNRVAKNRHDDVIYCFQKD
jgi:hypothetical protein